MKYQFYNTCVGWPQDDVNCPGGLVHMIDNATDITRRTFLKHVDRESLRAEEWSLGYMAHPRHGLTMAGDWHVSYHRSELHDERVYYFKHSAIEHVFTRRNRHETP